jgi:hypothetical protein
MNAYVIIATKGRAPDVFELLTWLQQQTLPAAHVLIIGADDSDIAGLDAHPMTKTGQASIHAAHRAGLTIQRNAGLALLKQLSGIDSKPSFVAFFDDDFRPATDWLQAAQQHFSNHPDVVGISGHVLADGVHGLPLTSIDAQAYISGQRAPEPHWASGDTEHHLDSLYGCNMAFRDTVIRQCQFDEALPFYGWQEDQDYTGQAARFGRTVYIPQCKGVHLGSKSGRTSGLRFGYSQIANPLYLIRKGTMPKRKAYKFIAKHLIANTLKSLINHPQVDYPGRLKGNVRAVIDLLSGRCDPRRVIDLV